MVPLPLSSLYITKSEMPNIMLGKSPERDREMDAICQMIENCAKAGIPAVKYNMSILGVVRTERTKGRGGASLSTFVYDKAKQEPPLTEEKKPLAVKSRRRLKCATPSRTAGAAFAGHAT